MLAVSSGGDRERAGIQDDEIVFTISIDKIKEITEDLTGFELFHAWESLALESILKGRYSEVAAIADEKSDIRALRAKSFIKDFYLRNTAR